MKLILDTDPGVDDAMAYFYAHAFEHIELIALTTIFGNVSTEDATRNALWLTEFSNAETAVYKGASKPLSISPHPPADFVHGPHGFGDFEIETATRQVAGEAAAEYLVRAASETPGELTVCAVGPLTNIARAIAIDAEFVSNLKQLVIMGGALDATGNVNAYAEANFWNDPHAANIVVNAPGDGHIVIVGLDVTSQIEFKASDFDDLAMAAPQTGSFLKEIGQFYMRFYQTRTGRMSCHLHDPAAVIASVRPEFMQMHKAALSVITEGEQAGNLVRDNAPGKRFCSVCMGVDAQSVIAEYKQITSQNP